MTLRFWECGSAQETDQESERHRQSKPQRHPKDATVT
jgi:hypothetical protein